ncbi:MAG: hypothetical protein AAF958_07100 [Planctomycetota bacterium]
MLSNRLSVFAAALLITSVGCSELSVVDTGSPAKHGESTACKMPARTPVTPYATRVGFQATETAKQAGGSSPAVGSAPTRGVAETAEGTTRMADRQQGPGGNSKITELKKACPLQIDAKTRWVDVVEVDPKRLEYRYQIFDQRKTFDYRRKHAIRDQLIQSLRKNKTTLALVQAGHSITLVYNDRDGVELLRFDVKPADLDVTSTQSAANGQSGKQHASNEVPSLYGDANAASRANPFAGN